MRYPHVPSAAVLLALALASLAAAAAEPETDPGAPSVGSHVRRRPDRRLTLQIETSLAFLGEMLTGPLTPGAFGYALRFGYGRPGHWDLYVQAEHGLWKDDEGADRLSIQTLDLGIGAGYSYFGGHMRAVAIAGASVLLTGSQMDDPGTTGLFLDIRPAGFRWTAGDRAVIEIHPLTFALVMPTLTGIPLVYLSYRSALLLEVSF